jgi:preprotein translocase subunit SecG
MQAFLPVLLVIHIIACVALVIAVMLQRSEGGALGMGGGGTGGIISGRGVANVLVRTTMGLAAVFFVTSVLMARLNTEAAKAPSAVEKELKNRKTDAFDPLKNPTSAPAPTAPSTATTTPAAPVLDPLAAPAPTAPAPAATTAPAAPATTPAKPTTAPAPPPSDSNGK